MNNWPQFSMTHKLIELVVCELYYENMSMQCVFFSGAVKIEKFQSKTIDIFYQNIDCGYHAAQSVL